MLQHSFINQETCPYVSVVLQLEEIEGIGLNYELTVSSSDGCALQECPMLLSPGERILENALLNGVDYIATLVVSNDCGSDSTTVLLQPSLSCKCEKYKLLATCYTQLQIWIIFSIIYYIATV